MADQHPPLTAMWVSHWLRDNKVPPGAILIDDRDNPFTSIADGEHGTEFGVHPVVMLGRDGEGPVTVEAYQQWLAEHEPPAGRRLAGEFYDTGLDLGSQYFRDLGESYGDGPDEHEIVAVRLQLRWG